MSAAPSDRASEEEEGGEGGGVAVPPPPPSPASAMNPSPLSAILPPSQLKRTVRRWIDDDVPSFDVGGLVVGSRVKSAELLMKSPGVFAGRPFFDAVFDALGCEVTWEDAASEGARIPASPASAIKLATVTGPVNSILLGERTALNIISRCSGVATASRDAVSLARDAGWGGYVSGTRKTTPGFRIAEKYGLLVGGAATHRLDLSQMVMIKDNHVWASGSIGEAVRAARGAAGFSQRIEVECRTLEEALEAAGAGADIVMLDNFSPSRLRHDARSFKGRYPNVTVEASGGITSENMSEYMIENVDVISQGRLTQGYGCVDYSLKIVR